MKILHKIAKYDSNITIPYVNHVFIPPKFSRDVYSPDKNPDLNPFISKTSVRQIQIPGFANFFMSPPR